MLCNIRDDASVRAALRGADAVVNCVGTFDRFGKNNFDAVQAEGAGRVARLAAAEGVETLVHLSAIGANAESPANYARTKGEGEAAVLAAFPAAVILRPSVIFGSGDGFFNKFASLARLFPVLPLPHAGTKLQPVYVDDVAEAAVAAITGTASPGIYELGGPEVLSLKEAMHRMLSTIQRRRLVLGVPAFLMRIPAFLLDMAEAVTMGLLKNKLITRDQITMLADDNTVARGAKGLADLGITPTTIEAVLPEYLWPYRPSGQFAAIKDSAKNLKKA